ncbi:RNA polymerase sigma factor [Flexithrix dorotheae]|uniref:RNA polymerase sigma factor n=1 Tax=Flexithrix dorotheae TaxID=70993 RepID=UPI000380750F|nr:sigma-70 family RNA polymerase sigma factor [Flexithrix dorotheae]
MYSENLNETEDENLWNQLRNGSVKALDIIYQQNYQVLFSFGYKLIPDKEIVKDGIQELFANLWNKHAGLSQVKKIRAYLLKALFNALIKQKQLNGLQEILPDYDDYKYLAIFSTEHLLIEQEKNEERLRKLKEGIKQLSKREKEIIFLFYYEGYSYKQIEKQTGLKYQSIKNLMYRALQRLKGFIYILAFLILHLII